MRTMKSLKNVESRSNHEIPYRQSKTNKSTFKILQISLNEQKTQHSTSCSSTIKSDNS